MTQLGGIFKRRWRKPAATLLAAVAGGGAALLVGVALAKTFTLQVADNAAVGTSGHADIVVGPRGLAVYELSGDSRRHSKCRAGNGCLKFWPPVTVRSVRQLTKAPGIPGRLGTWRRGRFLQVTLNGHPLYRFAGDRRARDATGDGLHGFGGTWHVVRTGSSPTRSTGTGSTTTTTTTTTTMTTSTGTVTVAPTTTTLPPPCLYPPCQ